MPSISTSASNKRNTAYSIYIPLLCLLCISASSCKKFLAAYSQNSSFVESTTDLDELLVGEAYFNYGTYVHPYTHLMDDDAEMGKPESITLVNMQLAGFYNWQAAPRITTEGGTQNTDENFADSYKRIARINTILHNSGLLKDKGQPLAELTRINGEAHFLRAFYYFRLVNTFGKPYKAATAAVDFGVPLKTDPAIKDQFASRSTVQQVYDQILADLLDAEKELEGANASSNIRANQAAVQCLLSRVYLFMENYEKAIEYANKVISRDNYQLSDMNNYTVGTDFITRKSTEVIFTMKESQMYNLMATYSDNVASEYYIVSGDLVGAYENTDLRKKAFFKQNGKGQTKLAKKNGFAYSTDDVSDVFLLRLSEMYLTKAEAQAALDHFDDARTTVQELRKKRFRPADLTPVTADGAALVNFIRDERRRELCFETHRWFDLRRYGVNSKYAFGKSIRHRNYIFTGTTYTENGYYELNPYDQDKAAYIVPIANDEIEFNQGLLTNEPRPARPLKQ